MPLSIYQSSAGSGKTYTLAKEYIKLLLQNPKQHRHILAVTFTNKATQEMKGRIISFLTKLSTEKDNQLLDLLHKETSLKAHQIRINAQKALENILHDYSNFTVLTIDSFFNRVIKAFARELGLPLQMDLQLDLDAALDDAYDRLMLSVNDNEELQKWLSQYMLNKLESDKGWNIEREIKDLGRELFKDAYKEIEHNANSGSIDSIKILLHKLTELSLQIKNHMQGQGEKSLELISAKGLTIDDFPFKKSGFAAIFGKWANFNSWDKKFTKRTIDAAGNIEKWHGKKDRNQAILEAIYHDGLNDILVEGIHYWDKQKEAFISAELVSKNLYTLAILRQLEKQLKAFRDENDVVLISDQNQFINQVIEDAGLEFMYEKTGTRFRHYLIDEFQDTSSIQWRNFRPLVENALAEGSHALLVGDAKQSIYRWRGGDMKLLLEQVNQDLGQNPAETIKNLDSNYRSHANIIDFNNLFFRNIQDFASLQFDAQPLPEVELSFRQVHQEKTQNTPDGGYVKLQAYKNTEDGAQSKDLIDEALLDEIRTLHNEGFSYGEMAVLVFKNKEATRVAQVLNGANIPIQSSESLFLAQSQAVQFIISCFRFLVNPDDELLRVALLSAIYQLGRLNTFPHDLIKKARKAEMSDFLAHFPDGFSKTILDKQHQDLFGLFGTLLTSFQLEKIDTAYLQSLGEVIIEYQSRNDSSLQNFIEWWDDHAHKLSIQIPEGENAVVIQTVHKSKGLEYPVVLMPYISKGTKPKHSQIMWVESQQDPYAEYGHLPILASSKMADSYFHAQYHKECELTILDTLNSLYVAFTRAEQRLYLFADLQLSVDSPIAKWLPARIANLEGVNTIDENAYEYGAKSEVKEAKTSEASQSISTLRFNEQATALALKKSILNFDDLDGNAQNQLVKGNVLHELLAAINSKDDIESALLNALYEGYINKTELTAYRKEVESVFTIKGIEAVFNPEMEAIRERDILLPDGIIRPDRVVSNGEMALVIDFKTGESKNQHLQQVGQYVDALKKIMPEHKVSGILVYSKKRKLVKVN